MSLFAQTAFERRRAAHAAFLASYQTDQRPAAIVESAAADVDFIAAMPGTTVWVRADEEASGVAISQVSAAYDRGDVRTGLGVITWGNFCPDSYSLAEAKAFFLAAEQALEFACSLD